ncbi:unnamed protein product [Menidia menidia]|uniref:(Atlantic silverside) hypothetical protein n=1 Tax=Menidia menidia TaxID=238744 RepID=A0A8S4BPU0_9TELE|nr:unnamed protein product [Menidia menidia]
MDMSLAQAEAAILARDLQQLLLDAVPLSCRLPRATLPNYDNVPGNLMLSSLGLTLGQRVLLDDMKVGIFAPVSKISKCVDQPPSPVKKKASSAGLDPEGADVEVGDQVLVAGQKLGVVRFYGKTDFAPAQKKKASSAGLDPEGADVEVGDQVLVAGQKLGVVRFYGKTDFAPVDVCWKQETNASLFLCSSRIGGPKDGGQADGAMVKKVHQVTMAQPKRNFNTMRSPKDLTSESSISR